MDTAFDNEIGQLAEAIRQKREPQFFEVRFQEIRTYRVFVTANNPEEADFMAIRELQARPDMNPIRSEYDFFTICPIDQFAH